MEASSLFSDIIYYFNCLTIYFPNMKSNIFISLVCGCLWVRASQPQRCVSQAEKNCFYSFDSTLGNDKCLADEAMWFLQFFTFTLIHSLVKRSNRPHQGSTKTQLKKENYERITNRWFMEPLSSSPRCFEYLFLDKKRLYLVCEHWTNTLEELAGIETV